MACASWQGLLYWSSQFDGAQASDENFLLRRSRKAYDALALS
jgi:hypothetical protein